MTSSFTVREGEIISALISALQTAYGFSDLTDRNEYEIRINARSHQEAMHQVFTEIIKVWETKMRAYEHGQKIMRKYAPSVWGAVGELMSIIGNCEEDEP